MNIQNLTNEIIDGRRLGREDDLGFLKECPLDELTEGADKIRKELVGERVDLMYYNCWKRVAIVVRTASSAPSLLTTTQSAKYMVLWITTGYMRKLNLMKKRAWIDLP